MADDNVLRIVTEINVAPIIQGTQQAVAAVDSMATRMSADFSQVATASEQMAAKLLASGLSTKDTAAAMENLGFSAEEINSALGTTTTQLDGVAAAAERASTAARDMGGSFAIARVEAGALSGSTGMLEGGLARVALASETLGPIMRAAFPAFAALALVEILGQVNDAFIKLTNNLQGYTEAVQKQEKEDIKATEEIIRHATSVTDGNEKIQETTKRTAELTEESFGQRIVNAMQNAHVSSLDFLDVIHGIPAAYSTIKGATVDYSDSLLLLTQRNRAQIISENEKIAATDKSAIKIAEENIAANKVGESRIQQLRDEIALTKSLESAAEDAAAREVTAKYPESGAAEAQQARQDVAAQYDAKLKAQQRELGITEVQQTTQIELAKSETERTIGEARVNYQEQLAREMYQSGKITLNEEVNDFRIAEYEKYDIARTELDHRRTLLEQEQRKTGVDKAPEIEATNRQLEDLDIKHQANMSRIDADGDKERRKLAEQNALAQINADEKIAESHLKLQELQQRETLTHDETSTTATKFQPAAVAKEQPADTKIYSDEAELLKTINDEYEKRIEKIRQTNAELLKADPVGNAAKVRENEADIVALNDQEQAEILRTDSETSQKIKEMHKADLEEQVRASEENVRAVENSAKRILESEQHTDDDRLSHHRITLAEWVHDEESAVNEWYTREHAVLEKQAADIKAIYGERAPEYKAVLDKLTQLDEQYAAKVKAINEKIEDSIRQQYTQITNIINQNLNQMLTTHQSFAKTLEKIWNQLVLYIILQIEKMAEEWILEHVIMAAVAKAFAALGITTGSSAQISQNEALAESDAGVAAANTLAYYSAINPIIAVAAAAAVDAIGQGYAEQASGGAGGGGGFIPTAERGGIVPGLEGNAVPIIAHAQEMVLPTEIANPLKSAISSGQFAGGEDVGEPHGDFPEVPSYRGGNETISPDIVASAVPGAPGGIGGAGGSGSAVVSPEILASAIAAAGAPGAGGGAAGAVGFGGAGGPAGAPAEISPEISPEIIASAISGAGLPGAGGGAGAPGGAGGIGGAGAPGGIGGVGGFASAFSEGGPGGTPSFEIPSLQDLAIAVPRATDRLTDAISSGDDLASTVGNRITHNTYNNNHLHMAPTFNGIGSHEEMMDVVKKAVIPLVQKGLRRGNIG